MVGGQARWLALLCACAAVASGSTQGPVPEQHVAALEALAELRDEPVMLNPSQKHHYKAPPPDKQVRPLTRWEARGGFLTPDEDRLACAVFGAGILMIHVLGGILGMPSTTRAQRMKKVAPSPRGSGDADANAADQKTLATIDSPTKAPAPLSLIKQRRGAQASSAGKSPSPNPSGSAAASAMPWWWAPVTAWFDRVEWVGRVLQVSLPPGKPCITQRLLVDVFKGVTLPFLVFLMWWTKNYSITATLYTALHGSYGLLWCIKSSVFPDPQWERPLTPLSAIITCSWLAGYWVAGLLVVCGRLDHTSSAEAVPWRLGVCTFIYVIGVVMMMCADTQKYFILTLRQGLITEGWFARCRNTNYLGEMMLYSSFAIMAQSWVYWCFLFATWSHVFLPNIYWKELSLMRKAGFDEYSRKSGFILPSLGCYGDRGDDEE